MPSSRFFLPLPPLTVHLVDSLSNDSPPDNMPPPSLLPQVEYARRFPECVEFLEALWFPTRPNAEDPGVFAEIPAMILK